MPSRAAADYADSVEPIVRKTAAWAWRLLVILVALMSRCCGSSSGWK